MQKQMDLWALLAACLTLLLASTAQAQLCYFCADAAHDGASTACSSATCSKADSSARQEACCSDLAEQAAGAEKTIEHLHQAIKHLQAAGLKDEAQHVRQRIAQINHSWRQKLLEQKLAQVNTLQQEIKHLRASLNPSSQIMVDVKVMEIAVEKMRRVGLDVNWSDSDIGEYFQAALAECENGCGDGDLSVHVIGENGRFMQFVDALRNANLVKLVAEPKVVTMNGRQVSFVSGGEIGVGVPVGDSGYVQMHEFGTRLFCTPEAGVDGAIQLKFALKQTESPRISEDDDGNAATPRKAPRVLFDEHVEVTLLPGQTLVLLGSHGDTCTGGDGDEVRVLVMVTPQFVSGLAASTPAATAAEIINPGGESRNEAITRWLLKRHLGQPTHPPVMRPLLNPAGAEVNDAIPAEPAGLDPDAAPVRSARHSPVAGHGSPTVSLAEAFFDRLMDVIGTRGNQQTENADLFIRGVGVVPATFEEKAEKAEPWSANPSRR